MNLKIKDVAELVDGKIIGNDNILLSSVARIEEAKKGDLTFLYLSSYEKFLAETKASAVLVKPEFSKSRKDITYIEVTEPDKAFAKIIVNFFSPEFSLEGIDGSSFVHDTAHLEENVAIGKNVVISANCKVGKNSKIFHNTVLLENVQIDENSLIFQNVSIREDSEIGKRAVIHPGVVIGSDGFGFNPDEKGVYQKNPQIGNVIIEDDVEIGAGTTIDRAAVGSTLIKRGAKIDNLVQIAHNVIIGEDTVISAQCGISGSTKIGNNCVLAGQVGIAGHIEIADKVILLAQSGVSKSITKPGYYFGYPAKEMKIAHRLEAHIRSLPDYSERIRLLEEEVKKIKSYSSNRV